MKVYQTISFNEGLSDQLFYQLTILYLVRTVGFHLFSVCISPNSHNFPQNPDETPEFPLFLSVRGQNRVFPAKYDSKSAKVAKPSLQVVYPIQKIHKAHYVLINAEASADAMEELTTTFRYNDAILRNLVIRRDEAVTEESPIMKAEKESRERKARNESRPPRDDSSREEEKSSDDKPAASAEV